MKLFQAIIRHIFGDTSNINLTDDGVTVTADLTDTTVTPGSYTNSSLTVDQKGRLTAASSAANTLNLQEINQDLATTDDPTFNTLTLTSATGSTINSQDILALDYTTGNNGDVLGVVAGALNWIAVPTTNEISIIKDIKATTIDGGTFTSGAWRVRDINNLTGNTTNVSLATNTITILVAGDYFIYSTAPAKTVQRHQSRLAINGSTYIYGDNGEAAVAHEMTTISSAMGIVTFSINDTIQLEHRCETTRATDGFGEANDFGGDEVYSQLWLLKIS